MQLFKSHGIGETTPWPATRSYRQSWFGLRRRCPSARIKHSPAAIDADVAACVVALARVQPVQWEDMLVSYERAA